MRRRLHGGRFAAVAAMTALASTLGGCWVVIGESFTDYSSLGDASLPSDAADAGDTGRTETGPGTPDSSDARNETSTGDAGDASTAPHQIDDCLPSFVVSNGIAYPDHAPGPIDVTGMEGLDTDVDPRCGTNPAYCLILASSFHIASGAKYGTSGSKPIGSRPLVIMAVHDLTIDNNGLLDLAGGDTGSFPGAGNHAPGAATGPGGGGGNAEPGGGNACGATGGPTVDIALVAGGNGGGPPDTNQGCRVGGSGGGAVQLVSLCGTITVRGTIDATGGGGGADFTDGGCPDGRGGGAGGTVWMQAGKPLVFDVATTGIALAGGGGGGGSCRATATDPWTAGTNGSRRVAGAGGICAAISGGAGGAGGTGGTPAQAPTNGGVGAGGGETRCGGGGGARGRLVLQAPGASCGDVQPTGQCDLR